MTPITPSSPRPPTTCRTRGGRIKGALALCRGGGGEGTVMAIAPMSSHTNTAPPMVMSIAPMSPAPVVAPVTP